MSTWQPPGDQEPPQDRSDIGNEPTAEFADRTAGGGQARAEDEFHPSLDEPLRLRGENATVSFDGRRVVIDRDRRSDRSGIETLAVQNIVSVTTRRAKTDDPYDRWNKLLFELHNGRQAEVDFGSNWRQVNHFQEEVTRAISGLAPTGRRAPREFPVGLIVFVGILIVLLAIWLD